MIPRAPVSSGRRGHARRHAAGLSMLFALFALAVLSLGAVALVRSVDNGSLVMGNLGFKRDATETSAPGAEAAITYLTTNLGGTTLEANAARGYLASVPANLDPTGNRLSLATRAVVDWDNNACASYASGSFGSCLLPSTVNINGNTVRYLVVRLCPSAGAANSGGNDCASPLNVVGQSGSRGRLDYRNNERFVPVAGGGAYYRILVRSQGGRNAVSFTETLVHF